MNRRRFLQGLAGIFAAGSAPAFVPMGSLMVPRRVLAGEAQAPPWLATAADLIRAEDVVVHDGPILRIFAGAFGGFDSKPGTLLAEIPLAPDWIKPAAGGACELKIPRAVGMASGVPGHYRVERGTGHAVEISSSDGPFAGRMHIAEPMPRTMIAGPVDDLGVGAIVEGGEIAVDNLRLTAGH